MFTTKIEVLNSKALNTDSKKHIIYFPGNCESFRDFLERDDDRNRLLKIFNYLFLKKDLIHMLDNLKSKYAENLFEKTDDFFFLVKWKIMTYLRESREFREKDINNLTYFIYERRPLCDDQLKKLCYKEDTDTLLHFILNARSLYDDQFKELCGDDVFNSKSYDYNFHFLNHHSRSFQRSMLTYFHYTLLLSSIIFSTGFFIRESYGLAISFTIIAVMCCLVSLVNYLIKNCMTTGNLIRFFFKPQDPIDAGVAYVYQLLKDGVHPSDIILHGFSWGGYVATEVLRIFEEKGVYLTLINNASFGSPPIKLAEKFYSKWVINLAKLLRLNYDFHPLETVKNSKCPIYMIQKENDGVIPLEFSLVKQYQESREEKREDFGYKVTASLRSNNIPSNRCFHTKALRSFSPDCRVVEVFSNEDILKKIDSDLAFCDGVRPYVESLNKGYKFDNVDKKLSNTHIEFVNFSIIQEK